jgi:hypothetical protein
MMVSARPFEVCDRVLKESFVSLALFSFDYCGILWSSEWQKFNVVLSL